MEKIQFINAIMYVAEKGCKWRGLRKEKWDYDKELYKQRNKIERFFLRIKRFRRVFIRYDKLDVMFCSFIYFVMIIDSLPLV
jgi:transposase